MPEKNNYPFMAVKAAPTFDIEAASSKVSDPELSTRIGTLQAGNGDAGRASGET